SGFSRGRQGVLREARAEIFRALIGARFGRAVAGAAAASTWPDGHPLSTGEANMTGMSCAEPARGLDCPQAPLRQRRHVSLARETWVKRARESGGDGKQLGRIDA